MEELSEHEKTLLNCFKRFYGPEATEDQFRRVADSYGDFKGYWAYYLRAAC